MNRSSKGVVGFILIGFLSTLSFAQPSNVDGNLAKLKDQRPNVRIAAIKALGRSGDERVIDPLVEVLKNDEDIYVGSEAATALGNFRNVRGVKALIEAYGTVNGSAHEEANKALKSMASIAIPLLIEALDNADSYTSHHLKDAFEFIGDAAVDPLIAELARPSIHIAVLEALGRIKSPRSVPVLIGLLKHKDAYVRAGAADALGVIADPRAIEPIRPLLKDSDAEVRRSAVLALGELKDAVSVDEIAAFGSDVDDQMKYAVGDALSSINSPRAIEHLMAAAQRGDLAVVSTGFKVYLRRPTPALTRTLIEALEQHGNQFMAEAFLKSGNARLASAARVWAKENGYDIVSFPVYSPGRRRRR
ncbi:MAG: HEAT repeat domain-containing protein [Acidobacteriota bacterium]